MNTTNNNNTNNPSSNNCKLSQMLLNQLSHNSNQLLQVFQQLPLKEKKILYLLTGEMISDEDQNLGGDANDVQRNQELDSMKVENKPRPGDTGEDNAMDHLDVDLYRKVGELIHKTYDLFPTIDQLLTVVDSRINEKAMVDMKFNSSTNSTNSSLPPPGTPMKDSVYFNNSNNSIQRSEPTAKSNTTDFSRNCPPGVTIDSSKYFNSSSTNFKNMSQAETFNNNSYLQCVPLSNAVTKTSSGGPCSVATNNTIVNKSAFNMSANNPDHSNYTQSAASSGSNFNFRYSAGPSSNKTISGDFRSSAELLNQSQQQPRHPILSQTPYSSPSLNSFLGRLSKPIPKRQRSKNVSFMDPVAKLKSNFRTPTKKQGPTPDDINDVDEFNDMFLDTQENDTGSKEQTHS